MNQLIFFSVIWSPFIQIAVINQDEFALSDDGGVVWRGFTVSGELLTSHDLTFSHGPLYRWEDPLYPDPSVSVLWPLLPTDLTRSWPAPHLNWPVPNSCLTWAAWAVVDFGPADFRYTIRRVGTWSLAVGRPPTGQLNGGPTGSLRLQNL